ncbi:DUF6325 family protein [Humibacter ginsenosidimutans]|uniref:DUF1269 domain-containing protein n=1 Tax=Humibacter ginsenosidimutans TaxID=2599293 RepID=A0A5B8M7R6_9MICO|nr:DUF6325 family protein [Humibacter ginsenosidimutans]QDZ16054.1 hypothetical protein FPZ11_15905 [Humibacter ginsenosidimutans]
MSELEYGPVEFVLVGFSGEAPDPGVVDAVRELVADGAVRIIDAILLTRNLDGDIETIEIEDASAAYGLEEADLDLSGLAADEDIEYFAESLEPGTSAELLVVELLWAKKLASRLAASGGAVLASERIPAPIVNEVVALARAE